MVINHVTFNENVECHQYSPTLAGMQPNCRNDMMDSSSVRTPRLKYTAEFLKGLQNADLSKTCPDAVKKGITDGKEWAGGLPQPFPMSRSTNRSVFSRPFNQPNYNRMRRSYVPYFSNNQNNYSEEMNAPIEAIGTSRYTTQNRNFQYRQQKSDNMDNFGFNSNLMPDFARNCDQKKATNEEDEPEWFRGGPTSRDDFIDLHGFEGPHQDNPDNHTRNDQLGCVDGNISGGPTSGASSNNGSPPAKSTPAKVTFNISKDAQRNKRPDLGRQIPWQSNYDNRQIAGAPFLNEFFKNYSSVQNQSNLRGLTPIVSVQDVESSLQYDRLKFKQMIAQLPSQNLSRNYLHPQQVPTAAQVLSEIDKILRTTNDPVYKRPEVRTLIKNIVESVIPPINLMNLMKQPLTEPQSRETMQAAITIISQAKQNASKTMKMRPPTESELRAHMDAILQDAIIKKRMENLNNELMKVTCQQPGGMNFPNQTFYQMFRPNTAGRFENHSQSDSRGQYQSFENGTTQAQEINVNRWFSPTTLSNKGLPQIPRESLRSEELESKIKQSLMGNDNQVK